MPSVALQSQPSVAHVNVDVLEMQRQTGWPSVRIQEPAPDISTIGLPSVDQLSMTGAAVGTACAAQPNKPIEVKIYIGTAAAGGSDATQPAPGALAAIPTPIEGVGPLVPKLDDFDDYDDMDDDMDF